MDYDGYEDFFPPNEVHNDEAQDNDDGISEDMFFEHEEDLTMYRPRLEMEVEEEDVFGVFHTLKVSDMTIKLIDAVEIRKERATKEDIDALNGYSILHVVQKHKIENDDDVDMDEDYQDEDYHDENYQDEDYHDEDYYDDEEDHDVDTRISRAFLVEKLLGGEKKLEKLYKDTKAVKKYAMNCLKRNLSEVLPMSLEEDILENILGHMDLLETDGDQWKFVSYNEGEMATLKKMYQSLARIFSEICSILFTYSDPDLLTGFWNWTKLSPKLVVEFHGVLKGVLEEDEQGQELKEKRRLNDRKVKFIPIGKNLCIYYNYYRKFMVYKLYKPSEIREPLRHFMKVEALVCGKSQSYEDEQELYIDKMMMRWDASSQGEVDGENDQGEDDGKDEEAQMEVGDEKV